MTISEESCSMLDIPLVKCDRDTWQGYLPLDAWAHYGSALGESFPQKIEGPPILYIRGLAEKAPIDYLGKQSAALQYLQDHQQAIESNVLLGIWRVVVECDWDAYADAIAVENVMVPWEALAEKANNPTEQDLQTMKSLMMLSTVTVFPGNESVPVQLSLSFECAWDPDHGLEVLIEQGTVKEIDVVGGLRACEWLSLL